MSSSSTLPLEIQAYVAIKQREKLLANELKNLRSSEEEYQVPVMTWMAQHEVDQLKLSSTGLCIERIDSEKTSPLSKEQRNQLIVQYFEQLDNPAESAAARATKLIQLIECKDYRQKKRVARLSCRSTAPAGAVSGSVASSPRR